MDWLGATILVVVVLVWAWLHVVTRSGRRKLPPGPYAFPIIGNVVQLGSRPQQSLANLSKTYGPLMSLHLGSLFTVVVSSQEVAKQVLQQHDMALCSRTITTALQVHDFPQNSVGFLPVGSRWRKLRKLCREYLFSPRRLNESQGLRQQKMTKLHDYLHECSVSARPVNVAETVFTTIVNLMSFTLFSVDFASFDLDQDRVTRDLRETLEGAVKSLTCPNISDFFPLLKPIDPQGIKRQSKFYVGKLLEKLEDIINARLISSVGSPKKKYDLLEALVNLMEDKDYNLSINDIKYLFLDLFIAGTHSTVSTVVMAMTELLFNPAKMANATNELRSVIGKTNQVQESDISRLPYLQAVIKETLRLHPPVPFLIPRKADYEVEINGYTIPKNAQIFVNVWAIGRDPSIWPNSTNSFEPERFLNNKIDFRGQDFTFIPFGSGRRTCPALPLADRIMHLIVASLFHDFDWKLQQDVDALPLMAIPIKA